MARRKKRPEEDPENQTAAEDTAQEPEETAHEEESAPPRPHRVITIHAEALSPSAQEEMELLDRRLEQSARDLISKKNEKAAVNSRMNGEIKEIDEEIESILSEMDRVRGMDAPGAQRTLFDNREPKQVEKGACTSCEHDLESCHYDDEHNARACTICACMATVTEAGMMASQEDIKKAAKVLETVTGPVYPDSP